MLTVGYVMENKAKVANIWKWVWDSHLQRRNLRFAQNPEYRKEDFWKINQKSSFYFLCWGYPL